jgi:hypothetical protein
MIARDYPYLYVDSPFVSRHYKMFCDLGYPQLDIFEWNDGEWAIGQYWNAPLVPSMTKFNYILTGLRNVEKSTSFVREYVDILDVTRHAYWHIEEEKSIAAEEQQDKKEKYIEDSAERKMQILRRSPHLMERIMKFGLKEMGFDRMFHTLEPWEKRRLGYADRQFFTPS